ncbi:MAG: hypothetical protein ABIJ08_07075, partial [Nanoarchaeota archaeon]
TPTGGPMPTTPTSIHAAWVPFSFDVLKRRSGFSRTGIIIRFNWGSGQEDFRYIGRNGPFTLRTTGDLPVGVDIIATILTPNFIFTDCNRMAPAGYRLRFATRNNVTVFRLVAVLDGRVGMGYKTNTMYFEIDQTGTITPTSGVIAPVTGITPTPRPMPTTPGGGPMPTRTITPTSGLVMITPTSGITTPTMPTIGPNILRYAGFYFGLYRSSVSIHQFRLRDIGGVIKFRWAGGSENFVIPQIDDRFMTRLNLIINSMLPIDTEITASLQNRSYEFVGCRRAYPRSHVKDYVPINGEIMFKLKGVMSNNGYEPNYFAFAIDRIGRRGITPTSGPMPTRTITPTSGLVMITPTSSRGFIDMRKIDWSPKVIMDKNDKNQNRMKGIIKER